MSARAAVHALLEEDETLETLGVQAVYAADTVDTPTEDCFLIIRWQPTVWSYKGHGPGGFFVWAHDTEHDFGRITNVLKRVRELLDGASHLEGEDGWTLTQANWRSEGPDLTDPGYDTRTRYAEFRAVSRYDSVGP
jgi:hypothetical protein